MADSPTAILRAVWYPTTVATISFMCKRVIKKFMEETCDDLSALPFKLHDFGARGVSSSESAALGGMAHLVNFMGSDTLEGILAAQEFYDEPIAGFSIPAAEHSTITSWGQDGEVEAYRNMIRQFGGHHHYAVVSDSYDIYNAVYNIWGETLRDEVKDAKGVLVVRPDSGVPHEVVTEVVHSLAKSFGFKYNSKGYKVLNNVAVIQGDGVCEEEIEKILVCLKVAGYSAENVAFGMGGALLQRLDRDTQKFAMKASSLIDKDGNQVDFCKSPVGDPTKASKKGRVRPVRPVRRNRSIHSGSSPIMAIDDAVYMNGTAFCEMFCDIRARANSYL